MPKLPAHQRLDDLPHWAVVMIQDLRAEAARLRVQRNQARAELAERTAR